jgi:hypothetical protein
MVRRSSLIACCVLLAVTWTFAESGDPRAQSDVITGTWTGEFVPRSDASRSVSITMELKYDGKGGVSGTFTGLPSPGEVKTGSFDPGSGALKLELAKQGEETVRLVLEGTVANGTATGHFKGEETGDFKLSKKAPTLP